MRPPHMGSHPATFLLALVLLAFGGHAVAAERHLVVRVTDNTGQDEYQTLSPDAWKELDNQIRAEARLHSRALAEARKEWGEDKSLKGKIFTTTGISARKAQVLGSPYSDPAAAADKVADYRERDMKSAERRVEADKERENNKYNGVTNAKELQARDKTRQAEKASLEARAREIYQIKLQELVAAAESAAAKRAAGAN